ncbi:class A beta-lactamase [Oceanicella sp. SM1341]|uniref:class A beta-lactamase n=1 Tax=Oceanicella sp. SM1341 TaxID=1548889 RepID=UPI000E48A7CB|nr:class A beta-lactamase [Oceanicella sp. SM1341]
MHSILHGLPRLAAGLALGCSLSFAAMAGEAERRLDDTVRRIEQSLGARVGLMVRDTGSRREWSHRAAERFAMNSTMKVPLCAAVLHAAEAGALDLDTPLDIAQEDMLEYAPVAARHVGGSLPVRDLCLAALDMSDNTATNLLIDHLGGPQEITAFLRGIGDEASRADRREPGLNDVPPGDERDTTTPQAMAGTLEALLLGEALGAGAREQLLAWMTPGSVTGKLMRAAVPEGWVVADKSGSGSTTRNLVGLVMPPARAPVVFAIFLSGAEADFATRDKAVAEISAAVAALVDAQ